MLLFRYGEDNRSRDEKISGHSQFPRRGAMPSWGWDCPGSSRFSQEAEEQGENMGKSPDCDICGEKQVRQGKQVKDWLV